MQSRSFFHLVLGAFAVASIALASSSCVVKTASSVDCGNNEQRPSVDCSSEVSYQGYKADGGFGILSLASGSAKFEETALRRISDETERFITAHTRLCRDYNACAIDKDKYASESKEIRELLTPVASMVEAVQKAPNEDDRVYALDALYRHTVPADKRSEEVALRLGMHAILPSGGEAFTVKPGRPLPTEARAWFDVQVTPSAYVYIFQKSATGHVDVLFPDERISAKNPLTGNATVRIPNGEQKFRLNEKDIGVEHVYFAASRKPLATLDAALARVREGKVTMIENDKLLSGIDALPNPGKGEKCRGLELDVVEKRPTGGCTRTRGLELDVDTGFGQGASIGAVTEPGDDLIVYKFSFVHTTLSDYDAALQRYQQKVGGTRGGMVLEKNNGPANPVTRGGMVLEKNNGGPVIVTSKTRGGMVLE